MLYLVCSCSIDVHKGGHWILGQLRIPTVALSYIDYVVVEV